MASNYMIALAQGLGLASKLNYEKRQEEKKEEREEKKWRTRMEYKNNATKALKMWETELTSAVKTRQEMFRYKQDPQGYLRSEAAKRAKEFYEKGSAEYIDFINTTVNSPDFQRGVVSRFKTSLSAFKNKGQSTASLAPGGQSTASPAPGGQAPASPAPGGQATASPAPGGQATASPAPGGQATASRGIKPLPVPKPKFDPAEVSVQTVNIDGKPVKVSFNEKTNQYSYGGEKIPSNSDRVSIPSGSEKSQMEKDQKKMAELREKSRKGILTEEEQLHLTALTNKYTDLIKQQVTKPDGSTVEMVYRTNPVTNELIPVKTLQTDPRTETGTSLESVESVLEALEPASKSTILNDELALFTDQSQIAWREMDENDKNVISRLIAERTSRYQKEKGVSSRDKALRLVMKELESSVYEPTSLLGDFFMSPDYDLDKALGILDSPLEEIGSTPAEKIVVGEKSGERTGQPSPIVPSSTDAAVSRDPKREATERKLREIRIRSAELEEEKKKAQRSQGFNSISRQQFRSQRH